MTQKTKPLKIVLLVIGFSLLLFGVFGGQYEQPMQYVILNGEPIPLSAIPGGWALSSITPMQIELCKWEFLMRDIETERGIADVHIKIECDALGQHGTLSVYTNANGYAEITAIRVDQATVTATHPEYYQRHDTVSSGVANKNVDWLLTPLTEPCPPDQEPPPTPPPDQLVKIIVYAQVDKKSYVITGGVDVEGEHYGFDKEQRPQRAVMWLLKNMVYTAHVKGWYNNVEKDIFGGYTGYNPVDFSYMIQIETSDSDAEYWVNLENGDVHTGVPPTPDDGGDGDGGVWAFLMRYWWIFLGGFCVLYALGPIASIIKAIKGK